MNINYYGSSKKGKKSKENEDSFLLPDYNEIYKITPDTQNKGHLFLLCDGMGGYSAGEVASQLCCGWLFKEYYENKEEIDNMKNWLKEEIDSLNNRLFQLSEQYKEYKGMGTTLVNLLIKEGIAYFNNVGDSRLYLLRENKLEQLTQDDSEVWKLYKKGYISKDEILQNTRKHIITQAMATNSFVEIHGYEPIKIIENDMFLLCSDGLTDFVLDSKINEILNSEKSINEKAEFLIKTATENKTNDDTTIIIVNTNL